MILIKWKYVNVPSAESSLSYVHLQLIEINAGLSVNYKDPY